MNWLQNTRRSSSSCSTLQEISEKQIFISMFLKAKKHAVKSIKVIFTKLYFAVFLKSLSFQNYNSEIIEFLKPSKILSLPEVCEPFCFFFQVVFYKLSIF